MAGSLAETPLYSALADCKNLFGTGKMLRSHLILRVGPAAGVAYSTILRAAAAVELIHAASLLHDDVIGRRFFAPRSAGILGKSRHSCRHPARRSPFVQSTGSGHAG